MTLEQLVELERSRAFEATRRFEDLYLYHVAFDDLNREQRTESVLARMVANGGRIGLIGPSGSGKSSVIGSVLGPLAEGIPDQLVPLRIPVGVESKSTVMEPRRLAQHIVRYVTRWASPERFTDAEKANLDRVVADVARRVGAGRTRRFNLGLPLWMADVRVSQEVRSAGESFESRGSAADAIEGAKLMIGVFEAHGLELALVIDDSDSWLRVANLDRTNVANAFFSRNVPMLAKELGVAFVVAIHEEYLSLPGYLQAEPMLSTTIPLPRLANPRRGIRDILGRRLDVSELGLALADVLDPTALDQLDAYYRSNRSLRDVLKVTDRAVQHACSDGLESVTGQLIDQAVSESL